MLAPGSCCKRLANRDVLFGSQGPIRRTAIRLSPYPACFSSFTSLWKDAHMSYETNGGPPQRLFAVRGATQVEANEAAAILTATEGLMRELIDRNELTPEAMVSCIFTTTEDLDAEFPAVAARNLGLDAVPLLCSREIPVPGSMPRVIRVMAHYYAPKDHVPKHAYLGGASKLRADLEAAQ
jgi:chorismate mutase